MNPKPRHPFLNHKQARAQPPTTIHNHHLHSRLHRACSHHPMSSSSCSIPFAEPSPTPPIMAITAHRLGQATISPSILRTHDTSAVPHNPCPAGDALQPRPLLYV
ncbi:hypothetical protein M0R45_036492 [Rubus argutus]|uniref:Uncharacterized protein n=1 Tax=Rubus argutus TaxID=59490 RepID=A0AAW1VW84_RUBAR